MTDLRSKTISGVIWGGIENFSTLFIQFACNIIIARILTPADFGLLGMISIFMALGQIILDGGFGQALIRKQNATDKDFSTVFYVNLALGFLVYIILFFSSSSIARFYNIPELEKIAKISFLVIPINSIGLIQYTLLTKKMDFKLLSKASITSALVSGIIGIVVAVIYHNVWALVVQIVSFYCMRTLLLWFLTKWSPILKFSLYSIKDMFSYSMNLLLMGTIGVIFNNIYTLFIGKVYNSTELGYFTQADRVQKVPSTSITGVIQRVSFPILSTLQNENERLKINHRKLLCMSCFIVFPLMFFLIVIARDLFDLILTEKWRQAVIYFQLLCITGALYPAQSINLNLLNIKGKGSLILGTEILRKSILVVILVLTIRYSMVVLMWGQVLFSVIALIIALYYGGREISLKILDQFMDLLPILISSLLMMLFVFLIGIVMRNNSLIIRLVIQSVFAVVLYYLISRVLKIKSLNELIKILYDLKVRFVNK